MRALRNHPGHSRRGVVLLVVLALLTLFAVVAVTFVFYSEQESVSARLFKDTEHRFRPDPDLPLVYVLNQLIFGTDNSRSALRWNDLLSNMYGVSPDGNVPFNGLGRRANWSGNIRTDTAVALGRGASSFNEADYGAFNPPYTYPDHNMPILGAVGDDNPNDSYDTVVLERSFVRPVKIRDVHGNEIDFDPYDPFDPDYQNFWRGLPLAAHNANPTPGERRVLVARPGGWDGFPLPADPGGDVRNLPPGWVVKIKDDPNTGQPVYHYGNDSYWVDIGFPVQTDATGRRYKPLAAFFVMDLGGLLNVNVHGNPLLGNGLAHASHQGFGPWEVDLRRLLPRQDPSPSVSDDIEHRRFFYGLLTPPIRGRYGAPFTGTNTLPGPHALTSSYRWVPIPPAPYYSGLDFDALRPGPTVRQLSGQPVAANPASLNVGEQLRRFPVFDPALGYETRSGSTYNEQDAWHPAHFNPFRPAGDDRIFSASEMEALLRHGDTGADAVHSDLRALLRTNLANRVALMPGDVSGVKIRRLLTTHSFDVVRPGVTPWWFVPSGYSLPTGSRDPVGPPVTTQTGLQNGGEFVPGTWRANVFDMPRIDLNRPLPDFPPIAANGRITDLTAFDAAMRARRDMCREIHRALRFAVGIDPNNITSPAERDADRWLAQLAVNIVDLRDTDDYVTAYNWDRTQTANPREGWVYGFELPRVVINEVYGQYTRVPSINPMQNDYRVYLWAELYNPLHADTALRYNGSERLFLPETAPGAGNAIQTYRLAILTNQGGQNLRNRNNTLGSAQPGEYHQYRTNAGMTDCIVPFDQPVPGNGEIRPGGDNYHGVLVQGMKTVTDPNSGNNEDRVIPDFTQAWQYGWYMVGPNLVDPANPGSGPKRFPVSRDILGNDQEADPDRPEPIYRHNGLSYLLENLPGGESPNHQNRRPTLVLQRLMCPNLPFQPDPTRPDYNNYITVDYVDNILLHNGDAPTGQPYNAENTFSIGKRQPYASRHDPANAANSQYIPQAPHVFPTQNARNQPRHTFYRHNAAEELYYNETLAAGSRLNFGDGNNPPDNRINPTLDRDSDGTPDQTLKLPFDWLAHFDREFVSTIDLVQASGLKPFEVLQDFVLTVGGQQRPSQHLVPWVSNDSRLYRALEYLDTRSRVAGAGTFTLALQGNITPGVRQVPVQAMDGSAANGIQGVFMVRNPDNPAQFYPVLWGYADNGGVWGITVGSTLVVEPGTANQEVIRVQSIIPTTRQIVAYFRLPHGNNSPVVVPFMTGRVPGKINLNAVNDIEVFRALLDWQPGNLFTPPDVDVMYASMLQSRNRNPFRSLATGHVPNGDYQYEIGAGVQDTVVRPNNVTNVGLLFEPLTALANDAHPWVKSEALNKIFNNLTVRSNCFAVWITVGYFEVDASDQFLQDANGRAREIGREDGTELRHRYFAIIDRSVFEQWMLRATMRWLSAVAPPTPSPTPLTQPNVGRLRQEAPRLDPRRDSEILLDPSQPNGPRETLPAPVVYWSRIQ
jgi:hypothetical protein